MKPTPIATQTGADSGMPDLATYVGGRIQSAMAHKGWRNAQDKWETQRLCDAIAALGYKKPRWQTAQSWIEGEAVPKQPFATAIARVLDMTLEELMGAALRIEPQNPAWRAFKDTQLGQSMTRSEIQAMSALIWPEDREPTPEGYAMHLSGFRAGRLPS